MKRNKKSSDKQILSIIIAGCGKVGMNLVEILTKEGLESLAPTITTLAGVEGLHAHGMSVDIRFGREKKEKRKSGKK